MGLLAVGLYCSYQLLCAPDNMALTYGLVGASCLLGVLFVLPIGGADKPVVISYLNSLSGLAAAAAGFVVGNDALIISGALVGALAPTARSHRREPLPRPSRAAYT